MIYQNSIKQYHEAVIKSVGMIKFEKKTIKRKFEGKWKGWEKLGKKANIQNV